MPRVSQHLPLRLRSGIRKKSIQHNTRDDPDHHPPQKTDHPWDPSPEFTCDYTDQDAGEDPPTGAPQLASQDKPLKHSADSSQNSPCCDE